jgi:hypothetical protein
MNRAHLGVSAYPLTAELRTLGHSRKKNYMPLKNEFDEQPFRWLAIPIIVK